jgi:hypothetical protein
VLKVTYAEVKALRPCETGLRSATKLLGGVNAWNAKPASFADLRAAGVPFDDLVWLASAMAHDSKDVERRLRFWIADCAARVLHIYEKTGTSPAPRAAIIAARQFARGEISAAAWAAASAAARAAASAAAWDAAWAAAWAAASAAARAAARDAEEAWQIDCLAARMSDEEPEDWPLPEARGE